MNKPAPLHLQKGDPVPPLPVASGLRLEDHAGGWLLLVFALELSAGLDDALAAVAVDFGKTIEVLVIDAKREPVASRRVGALVGDGCWFPLAVLLDPRGRVQNSATADGAVAAAQTALQI